MPKTKEQKQKEALERNRKGFEAARQYYLSWQTSGERYNSCLKYKGREEASLEAMRQRIRFEKWCNSVGLDTHGNVI